MATAISVARASGDQTLSQLHFKFQQCNQTLDQTDVLQDQPWGMSRQQEVIQPPEMKQPRSEPLRYQLLGIRLSMSSPRAMCPESRNKAQLQLILWGD